HIAHDPFDRNAATVKKVRSAALLLAMKHQDADAWLGDLVAKSDFHTAYLVLEEAFRQLTGSALEALFGLSRGRDRFEAMLARARQTHGALADVLVPVFEEGARQ